jgi:hypothetical protein
MEGEGKPVIATVFGERKCSTIQKNPGAMTGKKKHESI